MKDTLKRTKPVVLAACVAAATSLAMSDKVHAYDMDCKVILCIAGGFPSECSDAYRYMISRITRFPNPLPPFGFCAMSDGSEYTAHDVSYSYLRRGREAYDCPRDKKLFYSSQLDDHDRVRNETAFCYSHSTRIRTGWGRDQEYRTVYHNRSTANRVNFQLRIVVEPGTDHEFRSPLFRINYRTGYVSQTSN